MDKIREKMNKKGFTLAELLIVVAIIAVLVAVSVPIFNSKLEKAREATDVANMRAAKAAAVVLYLGEDEGMGEAELLKKVTDAKDNVYYDAVSGKLSESLPIAYGQGTGVSGGVSEIGYVDSEPHTGQVIKVYIKPDTEEVELTWMNGASKQ